MAILGTVARCPIPTAPHYSPDVSARSPLLSSTTRVEGTACQRREYSSFVGLQPALRLRRAIGSAARVRQQNQHRRAHVALRYAGATRASYWFWSHNAGCHDDVGRLPAPLTKWSEQNETAYETCAHWRRSNKIYRAGSSQSRNQRAVCLLDAEREFLKHAFATGADGRLLNPEQVYACPKKSGKTTFAAPST